MNTPLAVVGWTLVDPKDWSFEGFQQEVTSLEELDALLDTLATQFPAEAPDLVDVKRANGDHLAIGLGKPVLYPDDEDAEDPAVPLTVLTFVAADNNPPYYNSLASTPYPGELQFFFNGSDSEFAGTDAIALSDAREAVRRFVQQEGLPDNVQWQEV